MNQASNSISDSGSKLARFFQSEKQQCYDTISECNSLAYYFITGQISFIILCKSNVEFILLVKSCESESERAIATVTRVQS